MRFTDRYRRVRNPGAGMHLLVLIAISPQARKRIKDVGYVIRSLCHSEQCEESPGMDDVSPSSRLHTSRAGNENTCQSTVVKSVRQRSMQMPGLLSRRPGI